MIKLRIGVTLPKIEFAVRPLRANKNQKIKSKDEKKTDEIESAVRSIFRESEGSGPGWPGPAGLAPAANSSGCHGA